MPPSKTTRPSAEASTAVHCARQLSVRWGKRARASQMRHVESSPPLTTIVGSSRAVATAFTWDPCPTSLLAISPYSASHTHTVRSAEQL